MQPKAINVFLLFGFLWLLESPVVAQALHQSNYRFENFDRKDGLLNNFADRLKQDSLGFIWIAYYGGLSRFDGYSFKTYQHDATDSLRKVLTSPLGFILKDPTNEISIPDRRPIKGRKRNIIRYNRTTDGFVKYEFDLPGAIEVRYLYENNGAAIWIATDNKRLFLYDFKNQELTSMDSVASYATRPGKSISAMKQFGHYLLIGTSGDGLWLFDKQRKYFLRPPAKDSLLFNGLNVTGFINPATQHDKHIWIITQHHFLKIDDQFSILQKLDLPEKVVPANAACDKDGVLWYPSQWGSNDGLYKFDTRDTTFTKITHDPTDPNSLPSNMVYDVIVDREQNVWVGTDRGISKLKRQEVRVINHEVMNGMIWSATIFTDREGVQYLMMANWASAQKQIEIAKLDDKRPEALSFQPILPRFERPIIKMLQGKRYFWVVPFWGGIIGYPIDQITGKIKQENAITFKHDPNNINTISMDGIGNLFEDAEENLWILTQGNGIERINTGVPYGRKESVIRYGSRLHGTYIYPEDEKSMWVLSDMTCTLRRIGTIPTDSGKSLAVVKTPQRASIFYRARNGIRYLSSNRGLFRVTQTSDSFYLDPKPVIRDLRVVNIMDDDTGRLWLYAEGAISCFNPDNSTMTEFSTEDGFNHLTGIQEIDWLLKTKSGLIIAAGADGFSVIDPASFETSGNATEPIITKLEVNHREVVGRAAPNDSDFAIASEITLLDELVLDYEHNNFALEFSGMSMTAPRKNKYRYRLEGFDNGWIETDWNHRKAAYTNLDAGTYLFRISASNHHGRWSEKEQTLRIIILPPPWKTWWAYLGYALVLLALLIGWRKYDLNRIKLKHRAENLLELDSLKSRFFANISHEFRTPITLLLAPLNNLIAKATDDRDRKIFIMMKNNGTRLLSLVNHLLDLSKIDAKRMKVTVSPSNIILVLRNILSSYQSLADSRQVRLVFYSEADELIVYIDQEKIETVIHNILSNAFKFTPNGGEIIVHVNVTAKQCVINIKDDGIGISEEEQSKIFDRFYQVDNSNIRSYEGSGIGMSLAKELVELHSGSITVQSKLGSGSTFTISLLLGKDHFAEKNIVYDLPRKVAYSDIVVSENTTLEVSPANEIQHDEHSPKILIVEDNSDMRHYLAMTLQSYSISHAVNGTEGLALAEQIIPDLIITDVMMPGMDGYQLCKLVKSNRITSHIPVIMLTARVERESVLTGLDIGADDYLSKPFDEDELRLIVRNRIDEQRKMRERYAREITLEPRHVSVSSMDEKFLQNALSIIETHMDDEHFSIEDFARQVGYSEVQFYRKIKALTGQTPSIFLRTIRLKRAADLLSKKFDSIAQIAYSVGFSNVSYFNRCFKEQFGVTPGNYIKANVRLP